MAGWWKVCLVLVALPLLFGCSLHVAKKESPTPYEQIGITLSRASETMTRLTADGSATPGQVARFNAAYEKASRSYRAAGQLLRASVETTDPKMQEVGFASYKTLMAEQLFPLLDEMAHILDEAGSH